VESEFWLCLAVVVMDSEKTMGTAGFITRQADLREAEVGFLLLPVY
jgi:hypothetical protein